MPNDENEKPTLGNTLAAIAWAQLLVGVTAVAREDMRKLGALWADFRTHWSLWKLNPDNVGALAVALNISAVTFLTALAILERGRPKRRARSMGAGYALKALELLGYAAWYLSTAAYLWYMNPVFVYFAGGALVVAYAIAKISELPAKKE